LQRYGTESIDAQLKARGDVAGELREAWEGGAILRGLCTFAAEEYEETASICGGRWFASVGCF
jgi:hypothetical protein